MPEPGYVVDRRDMLPQSQLHRAAPQTAFGMNSKQSWWAETARAVPPVLPAAEPPAGQSNVTNSRSDDGRAEIRSEGVQCGNTNQISIEQVLSKFQASQCRGSEAQ